MTAVRLSRAVVVDGAQYFLIVEGGTAKECLSLIEHEADQIGAAPAETADAKPARKPRGSKTPAQTAATPAAEPPAPQPVGLRTVEEFGQSVGRVFDAPPSQLSLIDQVRSADTDQQVTWSDEPPVPVDEHYVGLDESPPPMVDEPPPPPPPSEEDDLRAKIAAAYDGLRGRVPPGWHQAVGQAYQKAIADNGGDLLTMTADQLRTALAGFEAYAGRCDQHLTKK